MSYSISVVVPNYNGKELLEENIPYIIESLKTSYIDDYEIIISDDNSTDNSVSFIKTHYPSIILIENKENKGFSGNVNIGIRMATKDLVLILNSDVQLTPQYFVPQLPLFDKPDTFGVMGKIICLNTEKIQEGAKYPSYSFGDIKGTKNYISPTQSTLYSLFLSGANALVERKKLIELEGFDEVYSPYYWEDVDLGIRAWRVGYKLYYQGEAVCRHPISATIKKEAKEKVLIIAKRNKMILHYLHLDGIELYYFLVKITFKSLFRLAMMDKNYFKSFYLFVGAYTQLKKAKTNFKEKQCLPNTHKSIRDITQYIKSNINFIDIQKF